MKLWILTIAVGSLVLAGCGKKETPAPKPSGPGPALPAPDAPKAAAPSAVAPVAAPVDTGIPGSPPPGAPPVAAPAPSQGLPTVAFGNETKAPAVDPEKILPRTEALRLLVNDFKVGYGRMPKDVNELVQARLISAAPKAPDGKKYVIDQNTGEVSLANQ